MNKPEANRELMAHWTQVWTTLGRWQALNARLSNELSPKNSNWGRRSSGIFAARVVSARASMWAARP
jgi:hypothetical protein